MGVSLRSRYHVSPCGNSAPEFQLYSMEGVNTSVEPIHIQSSSAPKYPACPSPVTAECAVLLQFIPTHHSCELCTGISDFLQSLKEQEMLTFRQSFLNAILQAIQVTRL